MEVIKMCKLGEKVSGEMYRAVATKHHVLLIKAIPVKEGYILEGVNGERLEGGCVYSSRSKAYKAANVFWPADSIWRGKKVSGGYRIYIG